MATPRTTARWLPLLAVLLGTAAGPGGAAAQAIDRDAYLTYVPLEHPSLVRESPASEAFHLFGDPDDPAYRDLAPVDGIDDRRQRLLQGLGARFGPIMVLNTTNLPMDFRKFMDRSRSFNLFVDTWSLAGDPPQRTGERTIDLLSVAERPCGHDGHDGSGDCLLQDLVRRFDPRSPAWEEIAPRAVDPAGGTFEVMFFDFPGEGPESWRREFEDGFSGLLPREYHDYLKVYVHPFIKEVASPLSGPRGYEFVLQYYFFYPTNDGGNNHEGDWEHINVHVAPLSTVTAPLTADQVRGILAEGAAYGVDRGDPLVIRSVDYYFHYQFYRMDYARPNAYAPLAEWKDEFRRMVPEHNGERELWKWRRYTAWWDEDEKVLNTHPICFVGADNKGLDQVLSGPGGKNRDSHGTYPYPGLFKDVGPGGATEQINSHFDPREYYRKHGADLGRRDQTRFGRGDAVPYVTPDRIEVWPDWERVLDAVRDDPVARRDWFWMVVPVRWGYPATESPFAGIIAHAETGNLSPYGPMYQPHWNRTGGEGGAHAYRPHMFRTMFPLGLQDTFVNSWGFMNLTLPVLASIPPLDFAWRLGAYPVRAVLQTNDPVYFPSEAIPTRFVGFNAGASRLNFNEEVGLLLLDGEPGLELLGLLGAMAPDGFDEISLDKEDPLAWWWQVNLYLGKAFGTQNTLLHSRSRLGMDVGITNGAPARVDAEFNLWEYAGSFRFNILRGGWQPYVKLGYGWTWYRVENMRLDGRNLTDSQGKWIHLPSFKTFKTMLPNSFNAGAGMEIFLLRSSGPLPRGIDVSLALEASYTRNSLGIEEWLVLLSADDLRSNSVSAVALRRWTLSAGLTLGF